MLDRRARQGGRHQARRAARRTPRRRRARSSGSTSAATSSSKLWVEQRLGHREGVLPLGHVRPGREEAAPHVHDRGRRRDRGGRRERTPTRSRGCTSTRSRASSRTRRARLIYGAGVDGSARAEADRGHHREALPLLRRVGRDAVRDQPADRHAGRQVKALDSKFTVDDAALFRHADVAGLRDTRAADPLEAFAREKGVTYVKLDGEVGILGNGAGLSMSTVDVVVVAGGRPANFCDLGGGGNARGRRRRARGDHARPAGASRSSSTSSAGSRAATRSRAGSSTALERMAIELPIVVRLDGTNAEEGRRMLAEAAPAEPPRRADDARRRPARGGAGGMSERLGERAEAYRSATRTRAARTSTCWSSGRAARRRRSTSRPAAATSRGACARRARGRHCDPSPGMQPDVICRAEDLPFADGSFDVVAAASRAHHFDDVGAARRARWRASRASASCSSTRSTCGEDVEQAEKLRDPSHVRNYSEASGARSRGRRPRGRASSRPSSTVRPRGVARAHRLRGRGRRARARAARPTQRRRRQAHADARSRSRRGSALSGDHRRPRHAARRPGPDRLARGASTGCATAPTARTSSPASRPARAARTSRACRSSTRSPRPSTRRARTRR